MDRKALETQGLTSEQLEFVMAENGKDVQAEQAKAKQAMAEAISKAEAPLKAQLEKLTTQNGELQKAVEGSAGIDEKAKAEMANLAKEHKKAMDELAKKHEDDLAGLRREADTKEFFQTLGKKFVTPETQKAFETRINEALLDKSYEGKNRSDLLAILTLGEDGKERTDIYAPAGSDTTRPPAATGDTNPPAAGAPAAGAPKPIPTII